VPDPAFRSTRHCYVARVSRPSQPIPERPHRLGQCASERVEIVAQWPERGVCGIVRARQCQHDDGRILETIPERPVGPEDASVATTRPAPEGVVSVGTPARCFPPTVVSVLLDGPIDRQGVAVVPDVAVRQILGVSGDGRPPDRPRIVNCGRRRAFTFGAPRRICFHVLVVRASYRPRSCRSAVGLDFEGDADRGPVSCKLRNT
jgi:hypothetical protein